MSEFTKNDARIAHALGVAVEPGPIDIPKPDEDAAFLSLLEAYDHLAEENARLWRRVRELEREELTAAVKPPRAHTIPWTGGVVTLAIGILILALVRQFFS